MLQHTTFSHPTSVVSPKFPHGSLGLGGWPLGYESEGVVLIVRAISFQDFQPICAPDPPTSQTDGQKDGRHAIAIPRNWHYSASRGKNIKVVQTERLTIRLLIRVYLLNKIPSIITLIVSHVLTEVQHTVE